MTNEERFLVDVEGYLLIKNVLTQEEVARLNALADEAFPMKPEDEGIRRTSRVTEWGDPFKDLMDHPKVLPYLLDLIGPRFRLDHDYCIFMPKGATGGNLHGGENGAGRGYEGDHWYRFRDGEMRNGLCVFTFFLAHADEGDGGFACVPGSHKANYLSYLPGDVRRFERAAHYVKQPAVEAGDVLFFTEALIHGTMPWTADHERRALLYKYSPGHSAWSNKYYDADAFNSLTDQQRRILAPPSMGSRPAVVQTDEGESA
ncbi:hypothetical protein HN371_15545 [Candidatus Poribacteria bacterium]|jgi:hypothetical protein|nr:hypothetical protein [Candidatus Poribacteria bacterium]MBT5712061.1 hypothetical protein [Candidatus Poribacteria bacterium]MBT7096033.1 hypothetical protein [Candidatus Poribacteria bacterium]MBT7803969.1 hypothetical protein [Candidatus Poribacteria bacterium]